MHVARLVFVIIICLIPMTFGVQAEPEGPLATQFKLDKIATPENVDVGDTVLVELTFKNRWTKDAEIQVTDVNPNPTWFKIDETSITGDAEYVAAIPDTTPESIVWKDILEQGETRTVTFKMDVIGGAGYKAVNWAHLVLKQPFEPSVTDQDDFADIFIAPEAPLLERIDNDDGDDSYLVEWSEVTGALVYQLEEDDSTEFDTPDPVYTGEDSEVTLVGRAPGKWYYRVIAIGLTPSQPSNVESATVVIGVPQLYDIVNPDREADYTVEWSEVTGATSYTLEEDDSAGFGSPTTRYLGPNLTYQVPEQPDGVWYYRVRANGPGGITSEWSLPKSTRVGGSVARIAMLPVVIRIWPPVPETPSLQPILNTGGSGDYSVNWSAAARAKTYILEEGTDSTFHDTGEIYVGTETSYDVVGRGASRLFYRVKARNPSGESEWSNVQKLDVLWEAEPNDSSAQANGPIVSDLTYFGRFPQGALDVSDYFFFDLPAGRAVELYLTNIPAGQNYDLVLRDTSLNIRGYSGQPGNANEYINASVAAGRYLVQVYHRSGSGSSQPYHLKAVYE
jgi:hypothetical protein